MTSFVELTTYDKYKYTEYISALQNCKLLTLYSGNTYRELKQ